MTRGSFDCFSFCARYQEEQGPTRAPVFHVPVSIFFTASLVLVCCPCDFRAQFLSSFSIYLQINEEKCLIPSCSEKRC